MVFVSRLVNTNWETLLVTTGKRSAVNYMDNRIFNINGRSIEMLIKTLDLFCENNGHDFSPRDTEPSRKTFEGYKLDKEKGFLLIKYGIDEKDQQKGQVRFPAPISIKIAAGMIMAWIHSDEARAMKFDGWDRDCDHDGSNELGWRAYVEDWGHINTSQETLHAAIAIRPAYMWYGK